MSPSRSNTNTLRSFVIGLWILVFTGAGILYGLNWLGVIVLDFDQIGFSLENQPEVAKDLPAPEFMLTNLENQSLNLSQTRDKIVVLNFWATWCAPCVKEMVFFQEAQNQYPDNLLVLAINQEENPETVKDFIQKMGFNIEVLLDLNGEVTDLYKVLALPNTFFIDQQGTIRYHHMGSLTKAQLDVYLAQTGLTP